MAAVDGVDVDVAAGEIVGLLGPNGAGKSTTFRLLAGLDRPDAGTIRLGVVDVTSWPLHRRARAGLGYLAQHASVLPRLTAAENVAVALGVVGRSAGEARGLLEKAGLGDIVDRRAAVLSGGERRRVEIVRCLALEPKVVLFDEPFAGVDPAHVAELQSTILGLASRGLGVLLTDHAVREALPLCHRAMLLDGGVVQVAGSPAEVASDPRAVARFFGEGFHVPERAHPLQPGAPRR